LTERKNAIRGKEKTNEKQVEHDVCWSALTPGKRRTHAKKRGPRKAHLTRNRREKKKKKGRTVKKDSHIVKKNTQPIKNTQKTTIHQKKPRRNEKKKDNPPVKEDYNEKIRAEGGGLGSKKKKEPN